MLFLNFIGDHVDSFKTKFHDVALHNKGKGISFLIADVEASQGPLGVIVFPTHPFLLLFFNSLLFWYVYFVFGLGGQYFGFKDDQVPLLFILKNDGQKYLKPNLRPEHIAPWLKQYAVMLSCFCCHQYDSY